jgi:hypothetical protein
VRSRTRTGDLLADARRARPRGRQLARASGGIRSAKGHANSLINPETVTEVFSLLRGSPQPPDTYLSTFFDIRLGAPTPRVEGENVVLCPTATARGPTWRMLRLCERKPVPGSMICTQRTRRERATAPKGFCRLGTMRKLASHEASFRSPAVIATLRAAHLSCAESGLVNLGPLPLKARELQIRGSRAERV